MFREREEATTARVDSGESADADGRALPLSEGDDPHVLFDDAAADSADDAIEPSRALALTDIAPPRANPGEALIRLAYRMGVPRHVLSAPFRRAAPIRLMATVSTPNTGNRASGVALRAGHFLVHSVKAPIGQVDFSGVTRQSPGVERCIHSFSWLADLAASAPRADCVGVAERITGLWLDANSQVGKGQAWEVEKTGLRLMAWLVHAPIILGGGNDQLRRRLLSAIEETANWLDRKSSRASTGFGEVAGWAAVTAAGLLLPDGKPRKLFGEAGLIRALGDLICEDGGVLSRCPSVQMDTVTLLTDLIACYEAVDEEVPNALTVMRELLIPPLLALRHGDGGLGSWQGHHAIGADQVSQVIAASGVRTRPLAEAEHWGFQRMRGGDTLVQFDAAPPPRARFARVGCASTLAFEMSDGRSRVIVNCGGSALAGGQVPARIGQGLRASAAHSTLVLDNANSTAVLLHGKMGKGVEAVDVEHRNLSGSDRDATRVSGAHDGYAARFGLSHRRILSLRADGTELAGEDILIPASRKGKNGKVAFAIRFHLGAGIEVHMSEDGRGASLLLPDGKLWHFRLRGDQAGVGDVQLSCEDSLWVDSAGRPVGTEQLVLEGLTSRGGGQFSWLLKKMG
ncbi:heparinase [Erythrobacter sp. YT30]|nr:heparinase [Erythrobacter sp. YT30]